MLFRQMLWMLPLFEGEAGGAGGDDKGGGGGAGGDSGGGAAPVSLRAQLASQLPEGERDGFNKWAETYTNDGEFVKGAMSMRSQFDSRVPVPGKDAKDEDYDKYFNRVGKPKTPGEYNFDWGKGEDGKPRELPDGDKARFERYKEYAHKHHHTQSQFEANLKFLEEDGAQQEEEFSRQLDAAQEQSIRELKQEWGPDYDANVAAAVDGGVAYAPDEQSWRDFVNLPLAGGIVVGDHPVFLKTMAKIGRASAEDQITRTMKNSGEGEEIRAKIAAIEQEAIDKGKSTASPEYHERLMPLYKKLEPKTFTGGGPIG